MEAGRYRVKVLSSSRAGPWAVTCPHCTGTEQFPAHRQHWEEDTHWTPSTRSLAPSRTSGLIRMGLRFVHSLARMVAGVFSGPWPAGPLSLSQSCRLHQTSSRCHNNPLALSRLGPRPGRMPSAAALAAWACSPLLARRRGLLTHLFQAHCPSPAVWPRALCWAGICTVARIPASPVRWGGRELCFVLGGAESQGGEVTRPRSHGSDAADLVRSPRGHTLPRFLSRTPRPLRRCLSLSRTGRDEL